MTKRKFLSTVLLIAFLFSLMQPSAAAAASLNEQDSVPAPPKLEINAEAACLMDADTGDVLYSMNADESCYPASTTKIMTCYLALKYGNTSDTVTLSSQIYEGMTGSSSTAGLQAGEVVTVYQLMQCMMIVSANEAANALAIYVSGSTDQFVELMNREAKALGCTGTHFTNPNGLHDEDHYTTASDLALITQAAMQYDTFRTICSTAEAELPATELSDARTLENTNELLLNSGDSKYYYAQATGVKTGYTTPAGYCLVSSAVENSTTLIGVVLGAVKTGTDKNETIGSFTESEKLLSWGFENYGTAIEYQEYLQSLPEEPEETEEEAASVEEDHEADSADETDSASETDSADETDSTFETDSTCEAEPEDSAFPASAAASAMEAPEKTDEDAEAAAASSGESAIPSPSQAPTAVPDAAVQPDALAEAGLADRLSSDQLIFIIGGAACLILILFIVLLLILIRRRKR